MKKCIINEKIVPQLPETEGLYFYNKIESPHKKNTGQTFNFQTMGEKLIKEFGENTIEFTFWEEPNVYDRIHFLLLHAKSVLKK